MPSIGKVGAERSGLDLAALESRIVVIEEAFSAFDAATISALFKAVKAFRYENEQLRGLLNQITETGRDIMKLAESEDGFQAGRAIDTVVHDLEIALNSIDKVLPVLDERIPKAWR